MADPLVKATLDDDQGSIHLLGLQKVGMGATLDGTGMLPDLFFYSRSSTDSVNEKDLSIFLPLLQ